MKDSVPDPEINQDLLGYHLGLLDEEEQARVRASFDSPEELDAACRRVANAVAPLDAFVVAPSSPELIRNLLEQVSDGPRIVPFPGSSAVEQSGAEHAGQGPAVSLRELVGLAAAILMFVGIFVPGYRTTMDASRKAACANNLRLVGHGYANYAEANGSYYPFVGLRPGRVDASAVGTAFDQPFRNSRHAYQLVSGDFVPASAFYCQGAGDDRVFDPDDPTAYEDFPDGRHMSYSTDLMRRPWRREFIIGIQPLMADMTPLFDSRRRLIHKPVLQRNSRNHGGTTGGQNVLYGNMSVGYFVTPFVGIGDDDIYRLKNVDRYTGCENPEGDDDAFLVP